METPGGCEDAPSAPGTTSSRGWIKFGVGLLSFLSAIAGTVGAAYLFWAQAPRSGGGFWDVVYTAGAGIVGALLALFIVGRLTAGFLMPRDEANKVFAWTALLETLLVIGTVVLIAAEFS